MLYLIIAEHMGEAGLLACMGVMAGLFVMVAWGWRRGVDPALEAILWGLAGAVLGALGSGVFDHYWFNMTDPHMTVLLWLYLGLAAATLLIQADLNAGGHPDGVRDTASMGTLAAAQDA